ncbi:peptide chain release factor N(5)-glutamine methyltransferase [Isobaculum melis]|uniref:Release factor glutamine methyltransferase n=1 Tax=Isobaculum melis TaxID=142588 RepID=A0A1H9SU59_9LACT|nr:peptide chain release factor N(5)-glutamine methyltransferase [Isobaculum melis]SER88530.1 release factor glutamine methyltransferase [Isobaculum melis]
MATNATYLEVLQWASSFLAHHKREEYAAERLLLDLLGWDKTKLIQSLQAEIPEAIKQRYQAAIKAHATGMPIQYLTGFEYFFDRPFKVTADTLIPRPETEEVVARVLAEIDSLQAPKILDVGTGSGIIGLTLKAERPDAAVTLTDISSEALAVAKENGKQHQLAVRYLAGDLFAPVTKEKFDVIVSNPPYIPEIDKQLMEDVVLEHEPHLALFAENDGLAIYQRFAQELSTYLKTPGFAAFEIGFNQGQRVKALFQQALPTAHVWYEKDLAGNDRMLLIQL